MELSANALPLSAATMCTLAFPAMHQPSPTTACIALLAALSACTPAQEAAPKLPSAAAPEPPPAAPEPPTLPVAAPAEPPANPYLAQLQDRRRTWQRQRLSDYVFVLDEHAGLFYAAEYASLRIVVRGGRVVEAGSLLYGGTAKLERIPTMDDLFDRAEQYASSGRDGVAATFSAEYDDTRGTLSQVTADGRLEIADDEVSFRVSCFSSDLDGCRPKLLSKSMCQKAGGWTAAASGNTCERNGWSIGLVSPKQLCCRTFSTPERDELTSAQCKAAGGQEQGCGIADVPVGSSGRRGTYCCRRLIE